MRRTLFFASAVLLAAGCASTQPAPSSSPSAPAADASVATLQTQMTELLERLDVLNDRIAKLEAGTVVASAPAPQPTQPAPTPLPPVAPAASAPASVPATGALANAALADRYRDAIILYGRSRYADARKAFQAVYDADPTGDLADNSLFWIGETYFVANDFNNAMRYYRRVMTEFESQNKAPDAMYKMGISLEKTGDLALARHTFEDVITKYPYSTSAASAKQELKRIKY